MTASNTVAGAIATSRACRGSNCPVRQAMTVGFRRLVEQDRREMRLGQSRIRPCDATSGTDFVGRERIERMRRGERRPETDAESERKPGQMLSQHGF